jgi:hypothetical protein
VIKLPHSLVLGQLSSNWWLAMTLVDMR